MFNDRGTCSQNNVWFKQQWISNNGPLIQLLVTEVFFLQGHRRKLVTSELFSVIWVMLHSSGELYYHIIRVMSNQTPITCTGDPLLAQLPTSPPAVQETPVRSLGREDPLEKGEATHSSVLGLPW